MLTGSELNLMLMHDIIAQSKSDDEALKKLISLGLVEGTRKKTIRDVEATLERAIRKSHEDKAPPVALRDKAVKDLSDAKKAGDVGLSESEDSLLSKQMNAVNGAEDTVLLAAFKRGFIKCVVLLLQNKANHRALDAYGRDVSSYVREKRKAEDFFVLRLDTKSYDEALNILEAQEDLASFLSDVPSQPPSRGSVHSRGSLVPVDPNDPATKAYLAQFEEGGYAEEYGDLAQVDYGTHQPGSGSLNASPVPGSKRSSKAEAEFSMHVRTDSRDSLDLSGFDESQPPTPRVPTPGKAPVDVKSHGKAALVSKDDERAQTSLGGVDFKPIKPDGRQRGRTMSLFATPPAKFAQAPRGSFVSADEHAKRESVTFSDAGSVCSSLAPSRSVSRNPSPTIQQGGSGKRDTAIFRGDLTSLVDDETQVNSANGGRDSICSLASNGSLDSVKSTASFSATGFRKHQANMFGKHDRGLEGSSEAQPARSDTPAVPLEDGRRTPPTRTGTPVAPTPIVDGKVTPVQPMVFFHPRVVCVDATGKSRSVSNTRKLV